MRRDAVLVLCSIHEMNLRCAHSFARCFRYIIWPLVLHYCTDADNLLLLQLCYAAASPLASGSGLKNRTTAIGSNPIGGLTTLDLKPCCFIAEKNSASLSGLAMALQSQNSAARNAAITVSTRACPCGQRIALRFTYSLGRTLRRRCPPESCSPRRYHLPPA